MENNNRSVDSGTVIQARGGQGMSYSPRSAEIRRTGSASAWILGGLAVMAVGAIATFAVLFVGLGDVFNRLASVKVGELRVESRSVPVGSAGSVVVDVNMGQGNLTLSGGASNLLDANFTYNVDAWKPDLKYNENGKQGDLRVDQARSDGLIKTPDGVRNDWDLRLKDGVPLTLRGNLGAGSSLLKLGGLAISELDMSTGAGEVTLDLSGEWKQDLDATLEVGAGDAIIRLPKDAGVRLKVEGGAISSVDSGGMTRNGNYYTNTLYGKAPVTVEITVKLGVGSVKVVPAR